MNKSVCSPKQCGTCNKQLVAAWLKSINLDHYSAKIIAYGYDSMKALDLANEKDIADMTQDASIAMKKPHRVVFIKEWQALQHLQQATSTAVTSTVSAAGEETCGVTTKPTQPTYIYTILIVQATQSICSLQTRKRRQHLFWR